jgi:hypothetical protein
MGTSSIGQPRRSQLCRKRGRNGKPFGIGEILMPYLAVALQSSCYDPEAPSDASAFLSPFSFLSSLIHLCYSFNHEGEERRHSAHVCFLSLLCHDE